MDWRGMCVSMRVCLALGVTGPTPHRTARSQAGHRPGRDSSTSLPRQLRTLPAPGGGAAGGARAQPPPGTVRLYTHACTRGMRLNWLNMRLTCPATDRLTPHPHAGSPSKSASGSWPLWAAADAAVVVATTMRRRRAAALLAVRRARRRRTSRRGLGQQQQERRRGWRGTTHPSVRDGVVALTVCLVLLRSCSSPPLHPHAMPCHST